MLGWRLWVLDALRRDWKWKLLILKLWVGLAARPLKEMKGETKSADPKKKDDNDESGNRDRNDKDDRGGKKGGSSRK